MTDLADRSPKANLDILRLQRHRVQLLKDTEKEKERIEKVWAEKEKKRTEELKSRDGSCTPKGRVDPAAKLNEIRRNWEKTHSDLIERAETNSREREEHMKLLQEQRLSLLEERARNKRCRFAEVQEYRSQQAMEEDQQLLEKLDGIRRRMERSQELHSAVLLSRSQSAARRKPVSPSPVPEEARLRRYLEKVQAESSRKLKVQQDELKGKEALRKARKDRWQRIEANLKTEQQKVAEWTKSIQQKHDSFMTTAESRVSEQMKTAAEKFELQRERAESCLLNRERLQQQHSSRQAVLVTKWLQSGQRVEALKQQRSFSVERHRNQLRCNMLGRERLYEALQVVSKCPQSLRAQRLLKELDGSENC